MKKDKRVVELADLAVKQGSKTLMSDAVGMPDEQDEDFIRKLITIHEKMTDNALMRTVKASQQEFKLLSKYANDSNDATVNKDSRMTYDFELPYSFVQMVEKYYPTMFRDRKHYAWLKKLLKHLMVSPNANKDYRIKKVTTHAGNTRKTETKWRPNG